MNEKQQLMQLKKFEEDNNWLQQKYEEMQEKYSKKYIAVKNKKVIASGKSMDELINKLKEMGEKPDLLVVEFITPKGTITIY